MARPKGYNIKEHISLPLSRGEAKYLLGAHKNLYVMVQSYIRMYYRLIQMDPDILIRPGDQYDVVEELNELFVKSLKENNQDWYSYENAQLFKEHIDFLTNVYQLNTVEQRRKDAVARLHESVKDKIALAKKIRYELYMEENRGW